MTPAPGRGADDAGISFLIGELAARGRLVRLGPAVDAVMRAHAYPPKVARLVGEAMALVALLGSALKVEATLTLQTASDGPVRRIVADYASPDALRGLAQFDMKRLSEKSLLGEGTLALTIDPGEGMERYQGVVELEGGSIAEAALHYFRRSEQIPTLLRVAVGESYTRGEARSWRAGALMVQRVAHEGGKEGLAPMPADDWRRLSLLVDTLADDELIDPALSSERLAYRLFNEDGVRVFHRHDFKFACRCSRQRAENILKSYGRAGLADLVVDNRLSMTCEFCAATYDFDPDSLFEAPAQ